MGHHECPYHEPLCTSIWGDRCEYCTRDLELKFRAKELELEQLENRRKGMRRREDVEAAGEALEALGGVISRNPGKTLLGLGLFGALIGVSVKNDIERTKKRRK